MSAAHNRSASALSRPSSVSSTLNRTASSMCPRICFSSIRIAPVRAAELSAHMVASLWSGWVCVWQQPFFQTEATASKVRKIRYVITQQPWGTFAIMREPDQNRFVLSLRA